MRRLVVRTALLFALPAHAVTIDKDVLRWIFAVLVIAIALAPAIRARAQSPAFLVEYAISEPMFPSLSQRALCLLPQREEDQYGEQEFEQWRGFGHTPQAAGSDQSL